MNEGGRRLSTGRVPVERQGRRNDRSRSGIANKFEILLIIIANFDWNSL